MVEFADSRELFIREAIPDERGVDNDIAGKVKTVTLVKLWAREMPKLNMHELVAESKIETVVS